MSQAEVVVREEGKMAKRGPRLTSVLLGSAPGTENSLARFSFVLSFANTISILMPSSSSCEC